MFEDVADALLDFEEQASTESLRFTIRSTSGAKWNAGLSAPGMPLAINHLTTRQNARVALMQSVEARSIVERSASTIADGGLRLELAPMAEILGITPKEADAKARDIEDRFHLFASDKKQHRSGTINLYQAMGLLAYWSKRDNDQFLRLHYEKDPDLQNPLQFDFIDPDQIRGDSYTNTLYNRSTGNFTGTLGFQGLVDGIKRDERGREIGYKVWVRQEDGTFADTDIPAKYPGGRPAVLHGFKAEFAGQGRGFSRLAHALQEFETLTDYSSATIKKAINQSNIVGFVKPSKDEDAVNPFNGILSDEGVGPAGSIFTDPPDPSSQPTNPEQSGRLETFYQVPEATMDTPGSMFLANLTKGSEIVFAQNTSPGDSFESFCGAVAGNIAASLNIPLEVVLMKFGQNYSASRATLLLFWRQVCIERDELAADFLNPILEAWLSEEIAAGRISLPGWSDPRLRRAWLNGTWIGSSAPDIDPVKSSKARQNNIEIGITNAEREARDLNGTSAADNIQKNNAAYAKYKQMPWNEPGNPPGQAPGATPAPTPGKPADKKQAKAIAEYLREEIAEIAQEVYDNA